MYKPISEMWTLPIQIQADRVQMEDIQPGTIRSLVDEQRFCCMVTKESVCCNI